MHLSSAHLAPIQQTANQCANRALPAVSVLRESLHQHSVPLPSTQKPQHQYACLAQQATTVLSAHQHLYRALRDIIARLRRASVRFARLDSYVWIQASLRSNVVSAHTAPKAKQSVLPVSQDMSAWQVQQHQSCVVQAPTVGQQTYHVSYARLATTVSRVKLHRLSVNQVVIQRLEPKNV